MFNTKKSYFGCRLSMADFLCIIFVCVRLLADDNDDDYYVLLVYFTASEWWSCSSVNSGVLQTMMISSRLADLPAIDSVLV